MINAANCQGWGELYIGVMHSQEKENISPKAMKKAVTYPGKKQKREAFRNCQINS